MCKVAITAMEFDRLYLWYTQQKEYGTWKNGKASHDFQCELSHNYREDISWWIYNIYSSNEMERYVPNRTANLDAYLNGWEVVYNDGSAEGHWTPKRYLCICTSLKREQLCLLYTCAARACKMYQSISELIT